MVVFLIIHGKFPCLAKQESCHFIRSPTGLHLLNGALPMLYACEQVMSGNERWQWPLQFHDAARRSPHGAIKIVNFAMQD
jgi:hypothetical protein